MIRFTVYGEAQPAGSKRAFLRPGMKFPVVVDANPNAKVWKESVAREAARAMNGTALFRGPLHLTALFYRPRPKGHLRANGSLRPSAPPWPTSRPDATKLLRGLEDALTLVVWADDSQVCSQWAKKLYGEPARVEVQIAELGAPVQTNANPGPPLGEEKPA